MPDDFNLTPVDHDPFVTEDSISADIARRAAAQRTRDAVVRRLPAMPRADGGRVNPGNIDANPSEAQKEAGNYAKDHIRLHGLDIAIENAKGAERSGTGKDGKLWSVKMPAHYGYIKGTVGKDKDHVDVYVGPHPKSPHVFVVDQKDAESGKFDEHKAFIGFVSKAQALGTYRKAFSDGRADERIGHVAEMSVDQFKSWLSDGDTTKPVEKHAGTPAIIRKYDVPYLAGSSNDGKHVYVDRRVPRRISVKLASGNGRKWVDPAEFLAAHESAEHAAMLKGKPYLQAHAEDADEAERTLVKRHGLDWDHYEKVMDGLLSHIEHEHPKNPPPDLYLKPYDHDKRKLLARLEKEKAA